MTAQQVFSTLQKVIGMGKFTEWLEWAQSLLDEFALQQLDKGFETLASKVGLASIQKAYRKRLLEEVRKAPIRTVKVMDINGECLEICESPKLEQFFFEIICLAKLAEISDKMELLPQSSKEPVPEAKVKVAGYDCLVEVKFFEDPILNKEEFASRSLTDPRSSGQSARSDQLPPYIHLRDKLNEVWIKFRNFKTTINLVFVGFLSLPELGITFVPALYGEKFLQVPFILEKFTIPVKNELGEDGLFAAENWRFVSGIAAVWAQRYPLIPPWQEIRWYGMLFDNPKALVPISREVSLKLTVGFNMPSKFIRAEINELYDRYIRPLEEKFWGRLVAISRNGEILLGSDNEVELSQKAIEQFGRGNFIVFRVGPRAVAKI